MKASGTVPFGVSQLITLQDDGEYLENLRFAGKVAAKSLKLLQELCEGKTFHSMATLDEIVGRYIRDQNCIPTFKDYKGRGSIPFPGNLCISVNKVLVHGVPDDTVLKDGDIVKFDLGVTYKGAIADTAISLIFGQPISEQHVKMLKDTEDALMKAISTISAGKRLGCIGHSIYNSLKNNYKVVENYGGHGISMTADGVGIPHASPFVSNRSQPSEGIRFQRGFVLAIEPMALPITCSTKTKVANDGWSVLTEDVGNHWEHTLYLHEEKVEIITDRSKV